MTAGIVVAALTVPVLLDVVVPLFTALEIIATLLKQSLRMETLQLRGGGGLGVDHESSLL